METDNRNYGRDDAYWSHAEDDAIKAAVALAEILFRDLFTKESDNRSKVGCKVVGEVGPVLSIRNRGGPGNAKKGPQEYNQG